MCPFHLTFSLEFAIVTSRAYLDSLMSENLSFTLPKFCIALRNATDYIRYLYCHLQADGVPLHRDGNFFGQVKDLRRPFIAIFTYLSECFLKYV